MLTVHLCSSDQQGGKEIESLEETPPVTPIACSTVPVYMTLRSP